MKKKKEKKKEKVMLPDRLGGICFYQSPHDSLPEVHRFSRM